MKKKVKGVKRTYQVCSQVKMEENKVIFEDENGNETEFDIIEETKINNVNYVLVATSDEDDDEAYILKEESDDLGSVSCIGSG